MKRLSVAPRLTPAFLPIAPVAATTMAPALCGVRRATFLPNLQTTARKYDSHSIPDARLRDETAAAEIGGFFV